MHEAEFTDKIVDVILEELKKHPGAKIRSVTVKVGEVYHLVLESVLMHFEVGVKGTPLESVTLDLVEEAVQVNCRKCGRDGPVEDHHMLLCSFCQSIDVKTIAGNTITIESIRCED